jgi:hypothetical protein
VGWRGPGAARGGSPQRDEDKAGAGVRAHSEGSDRVRVEMAGVKSVVAGMANAATPRLGSNPTLD